MRNNSHSVAEPGPLWQALAPDWELVHDLMGGTRQMRAAGLRWLPKENSESWDAWRTRLNRSVLFNGFGRTIAALAGRPFAENVAVKNAHPSIQAVAANMDGRGMSLTSFAGNLLRLMLRDGMAYILVDAKPEGGVPYCVLLEAAQMIGLRHDATGTGIIQARIRERVIEKKSQFSDDWVEQIRVLEPSRWTLYKQDHGRFGGWKRKAEGAMGIAEVPLVECAVYADYGKSNSAAPPLLDLAWLNIAHWQSSSDQRHILHIARVPILFARGMDTSEGRLDIGPNRLIIADDASADMKFVEHSGAAIAAGRQDLLDLEEKMAVMELDLLARRPGNSTATARAIDRAQSNAFLHMLVDDVRDHLNHTLRLVARWLDLPETAAGEVVLPKHFPIDLATSDSANQLLETHSTGNMSAEEFLAAIERKGLMQPAHS